MTDPRKTLAPLLPALAARKDRDAQSLAEIRSQIANLDAERARIEAEITQGAAQLDAADLNAGAVFHQWREAQRARLRALADRRRAFEVEDDARREVLLQSNGEVRAAETLIDRANAQEREQAEAKRQRRTPAPRPRGGGGTKPPSLQEGEEPRISQAGEEV